MTQREFLKGLKREYKKNVDISRAKNHDYSRNDDAFANFRVSEALGIDPKIGIIVRMTDKIIRIKNLLTKENKVKDEKVSDTLSDLANYAMILKLFIQEETK